MTPQASPTTVVVDLRAITAKATPNMARTRAVLEDLARDGATVVCVAAANIRHRIAESDRALLEQLCDSAQLITPPAGATGGLGGFLAALATRATVVTNDRSVTKRTTIARRNGHWQLAAA